MGPVNRGIMRFYLWAREKISSAYQQIPLPAPVNNACLFIGKIPDTMFIGYFLGSMAKRDLFKAASVLGVKPQKLVYLNAWLASPIVAVLNHYLWGSMGDLSEAAAGLATVFNSIASFFHGLSIVWPVATFIWNSLIRGLICLITRGKKIPLEISLMAFIQNLPSYFMALFGGYRNNNNNIE